MDDDEGAKERFLQYLSIRSVHPNPDYKGCVDWLYGQASEIGLLFNVHEVVPGKPIVILSLISAGSEGIMLNSHMDVVPADPSKWILGQGDPFKPVVTSDGKIVARGSQDMKCVGLMQVNICTYICSKYYI